jgi:WD40 repeat protein/Ca2+-binding EF-hand superfamily protein
MPANEVFFPSVGLNQESDPLPLPSALSARSQNLTWVSKHDCSADLDIGMLMFSNKGHKVDEVTFSNPSSSDNAAEHLGDALGGSEDGDSETILLNLSKVAKRVFCIALVATASTGSLGDCERLGCNIMQRFSKKRGEIAQKEVVRCDCDVRDLQPSEGDKTRFNAQIMLMLYRTSEHVENDSQGPAGWTCHAILSKLESKNVDECVPAAQRSLQAVLPFIIVRGEELPINTVTDIIAFIQPVTLAFFRTNFPQRGYLPDDFAQTMCKVLLKENRILRKPKQASRLLMLLYEMFKQIDVNGEGVMHWGEFTSFCVSAGMSASLGKTKPCAPDVEFKFGANPKFRHSGQKYSSIKVWEAVSRIAFVEERGSKIRIVNRKTGDLDLVMCIFNKKAYDEEPLDPLDEAGYLTVMDCVYFTNKSNHWIAVAGSDYSISFWKYEPLKRLIVWTAAIATECVQNNLLFVPPTPHAKGTLWSTGSDCMLSQWDLDTKRRIHHAENAHTDSITAMIFVPSILQVATASMDKEIKFWDFDTCRIRGRPLVTDEPVRKLSHSIEKLVSCGPCNVRVWEFQSMSELYVISLATPNLPTFINASIITFYDIKQGPQTRVLTGDASGSFKLWTLSDNATAGEGKSEVLGTFKAKLSLGSMLEFATATSSRGGCWPDIYLAGTGRETEQFSANRVMKPHTTMPFAVHLYSSNAIVAVGHKDLMIWDIMTGTETFHVADASEYEITAITIDFPLQRKLYIGNSKGEIVVFNAFSCSEICRVEAHEGAVLSICFCELTRHIVSCGNDRSVKVFKEELDTMTQLRALTNSHPIPVSCFEYSPFLSLFVTVSGEDIKVWDFTDMQLQDHLDQHATEVTAVTWVRKLPLLVSGDIQGRILVWSVETRTALASAYLTCLFSCVLDAPPGSLDVVQNVRHLKLLYETADKEKSHCPISLICSDFSGLVCIWDFESIVEKSGLTLMERKEWADAGENYNADLRYEKNGAFSMAKRNRSMFPTKEIPTIKYWKAHDESILSLETLQAAPMIVTTAADCKLRLWAATPCMVGLRHCDAGTLFGEVDTMDYEEQRELRLDRWSCPNVMNVSEMEETKQKSLEILEDVIEDDGDHSRRLMEDLMTLNPALFRANMSGRDGVDTTPMASPIGRAGKGGGFGATGPPTMGVDRRRMSTTNKKKQPISEAQHKIKKRLQEITPKKTPNGGMIRRASMKRVSMVISADDDTNMEKELMEMFADKSDEQEQQRLKKAQVKKIIDGMRQHMTSAYTSKTRTGKVIYSNLYTETKSKDRSGGIEFSTNDFGPSDFLKEKMEQERMRKKLVRAKARQKKEKLVEAAQRLKEEEESQMDEYTLACLEEERETSERKQLGREQSARDTNVELPSSFFMTDRPETPKLTYDLGPGMELEDTSVGSLRSEESFDSLVGGGLSIVSEASIERVMETREDVKLKLKREEKLLRYRRKTRNAKASNLKSGAAGGKRMTLMGRQTELSRNTVSKMSAERRKSLQQMKRQSIAMASHFGTYTRTEVIELAELLDAMDFDGDGNISATEFEYYIQNGKYGDTFKHLQFEVIDVDKSGEITVPEVVALVFHKAPKDERRRIMICIEDDIAKRAAHREKLKKQIKNRRITTMDMDAARQMFSYFDVTGKGRVTVSEINQILLSDDKIKNVLNENDVRVMVREFGEKANGKKGEVSLDLDGFVNFTYSFKGGYEVVDRHNVVVERRKLD